MLKLATSVCVRAFERYLPDPFVIVLVMTGIVFLGGVFGEGQSPSDMLVWWREGFWELLSFAMQMALILLLGYTLARTPLVSRGIVAVTRWARTPGSAIVVVTLVSLGASWLNWGFGLVVGAIVGREMARRVPGLDYRLLIASAYSGFLIWHGGLSASIPLLIASPGHFLEASMGVVGTDRTIFSAFNLGLTAVLVVVVPLTNWLLLRTIEEPVTIPRAVLEESDRAEAQLSANEDDGVPLRPAEWLESTALLPWAAALMGLGALLVTVRSGAFVFDLDTVNFALVFLALALHGSMARFLKVFAEGVSNAAGILLQFPFYAGIMGMMAASGLTDSVSLFFIEIADERTLAFLTFLAAGLVNIFIPSGGGQWAVQGPVMVEAAQVIGVDVARIALAVAWGEAWTNMIQPFWALPAPAIAGLRAADIMGFCVLVLLVSGVVMGAAFLLF